MHNIDDRLTKQYYDIQEWADLMIEGHTPPIKGKENNEYFCPIVIKEAIPPLELALVG